MHYRWLVEYYASAATRAALLASRKVRGLVVEAYGRVCRVPNVGPTIASKILHLVMPYALPPGDRSIYNCLLGKEEPDGEGYLEYAVLAALVALKVCAEIVAYLSRRYERPKPKIIDEWLWTEISKDEQCEKIKSKLSKLLDEAREIAESGDP